MSRLPRLLETAAEISAMARAMGADPASSVFLGEAASEGQVKAMDLSDARVIAFATHGLVPGDLNGLAQPALALTSSQVAGGRRHGRRPADRGGDSRPAPERRLGDPVCLQYRRR
jgi:hypothetical protein